jgi:hypothetical protein
MAAPDVTLFFTDVDLFKPSTDGSFGDIDVPGRAGLVSVRRLREAFYKRKADPAKQRARIVKLALYVAGTRPGPARLLRPRVRDVYDRRARGHRLEAREVLRRLLAAIVRPALTGSDARETSASSSQEAPCRRRWTRARRHHRHPGGRAREPPRPADPRARQAGGADRGKYRLIDIPISNCIHSGWSGCSC